MITYSNTFMKFHSKSIWASPTQFVTRFINVDIGRVDAKKGPNSTHIEEEQAGWSKYLMTQGYFTS